MITSKQVRYTDGWKYRLESPAFLKLPDGMRVLKECDTPYLSLSGRIATFKPGYCWNGASGIAWDDDTNRRSSLFHDGLYQLIGMDCISKDSRIYADKVLRECSKQDGMNSFRAYYYYHGVRLAGGSHTTMPKLKITPKKIRK